MDIQNMIVLLIIAGAVGFAGVAFVRKTRSFLTKKNCGSNCGCSKVAK